MKNKRVFMPYGLRVFFIAVLAFSSSSVSATVITFDLEGEIETPSVYFSRIVAGVRAARLVAYSPSFETKTGNTFKSTVNRGDLVLSYDDKDSASFADDTLRITGTTFGCHNAAGAACDSSQASDWKSKYPSWWYSLGRNNVEPWWVGQGEFQWELELTNPIIDPNKPHSTDSMNDLVFGMQSMGTITLLNPANGAPIAIDVIAKEHSELQYAFRLFQEEGDQYRISSWILLQNGIIGSRNAARVESLVGEAVFNSDLIAYKRGEPTIPEIPMNEVPEPTSLLLFGSAIAFGSRFRKR